MSNEQLKELLQIAIGALADIGHSDTMTDKQRRAKAKRIHDELSKALGEQEPK